MQQRQEFRFGVPAFAVFCAHPENIRRFHAKLLPAAS